MTRGEMLLKNHVVQVGQLRSLEKRIAYLKSGSSVDELIENQALKRTPLTDQRIQSQGTESTTERIALNYDSIMDGEEQAVLSMINALQERMLALRKEIELFDCVITGLSEQDAWLVRGYYVEGKTLDALSAEAADKGIACGRGTLQKRKQRVIDQANELLEVITVSDETQRK